MEKVPTYNRFHKDWLYHVWEADNHRDPAQHAALLRLQRRVSDRIGYQDYFRQQARQRESKHRAFTREIEPMTEPDAVVNAASENHWIRDVLLRLEPLEAEILLMVIERWTYGDIATLLSISIRTVDRTINSIRKRLRPNGHQDD